MKVLFITNTIPFKHDSGVKVKIFNLIKCLTRLHDVSCVFITTPTPDNLKTLKENKFKTTNYLIASKSSRYFFSRYMINLFANLFFFISYRNSLAQIIKNENPDIIWLEYGYICHLIPFLKKYSKPVIYSSHNSQLKLDYDRWRNNSNIVNKIKMFPYLLTYYIQERHLLKSADKIFCISHTDRFYYSHFIQHDKLHYLPFIYDDHDIKETLPFSSNHMYICIAGSLKSYQNYAAVMFLLSDIWPIIHREIRELYLYIVGELPNNSSLEGNKLRTALSVSPNVITTDKVPSVIPYVKGATISIVPVFIASGMRTKIIESMICGTPVVSTSVGATDIPLKNEEGILIADSAEGLAQHSINLFYNQELRKSIAEQAYNTYLKEYSLSAGISKLTSLLDDIYLNHL